MIQDNIARILSEIDDVCRKNGRDPKDIAFVAVTKFADILKIKEVVAAGVMHIGENKVQEAQKKFPALGVPDIKVTRHMIGHLQTNKVKHALEVFDCIQSVDSLKLAVALDAQAAKIDKDIDILIQVNIAGEQQKFGIAPSEAFTLIDEIIKLKHVHLQGLMAIAPLAQDKEVTRKCFRALRLLRDQISERYVDDDRVDMKCLSMGMTNDFQIAIEEGANMVRIGRAIFSEG